MKFNDNQKKIGRIPDQHLDKEIPLPSQSLFNSKIIRLKI